MSRPSAPHSYPNLYLWMSDDTIGSTFPSCFPLCYFTIVSVSSTTASLHPPRSTFGLLITPSHSPSGIEVHCALIGNYHYPWVVPLRQQQMQQMVPDLLLGNRQKDSRPQLNHLSSHCHKKLNTFNTLL